MRWLEDVWGWLLSVLGAAALALVASHSRVRDRVARLEVEMRTVSETLADTAGKVDSLVEAVIRLEAASDSERETAAAITRKLDSVLTLLQGLRT